MHAYHYSETSIFSFVVTKYLLEGYGNSEAGHLNAIDLIPLSFHRLQKLVRLLLGYLTGSTRRA